MILFLTFSLREGTLHQRVISLSTVTYFNGMMTIVLYTTLSDHALCISQYRVTSSH